MSLSPITILITGDTGQRPRTPVVRRAVPVRHRPAGWWHAACFSDVRGQQSKDKGEEPPNAIDHH